MTSFVELDCAIRQLHARFADAVWRQDGEQFANCFAEQGEWHIAGTVFKSRAAILQAAGGLLGRCERIRIMAGQPLLDVNGDEAVGRVPVTELAKMQDGSSAMTLGTYYDRYVKEGKNWCFQWRHFGLHYRGPVDLSADFIPGDDYGSFPAMPGINEVTRTTLKAAE